MHSELTFDFPRLGAFVYFMLLTVHNYTAI